MRDHSCYYCCCLWSCFCLYHRGSLFDAMYFDLFYFIFLCFHTLFGLCRVNEKKQRANERKVKKKINNATKKQTVSNDVIDEPSKLIRRYISLAVHTIQAQTWISIQFAHTLPMARTYGSCRCWFCAFFFLFFSIKFKYFTDMEFDSIISFPVKKITYDGRWNISQIWWNITFRRCVIVDVCFLFCCCCCSGERNSTLWCYFVSSKKTDFVSSCMWPKPYTYISTWIYSTYIYSTVVHFRHRMKIRWPPAHIHTNTS